MFDIQFWELLSYIVTVIGLPLAIVVFILERRKERENDEEEVYLLLSDNYQDFLKVALEHSELALFSRNRTDNLNAEQQEKAFIIFSMLVSLFERAYLLLHERKMSPTQQRRWRTWEDYMREWCAKGDFLAVLPTLLENEDPEFVAYIEELVRGKRVKSAAL